MREGNTSCPPALAAAMPRRRFCRFVLAMSANYTLANYTLANYTLASYTLANYTLANYTLASYTLASYTTE